MLTPQTGRLTKILLLIALGILIASPARLPIRTVTAQDLDYDEEFMKGRDLYRRGKFEDALRSDNRANDVPDKKPPEPPPRARARPDPPHPPAARPPPAAASAAPPTPPA